MRTMTGMAGLTWGPKWCSSRGVWSTQGVAVSVKERTNLNHPCSARYRSIAKSRIKVEGSDKSTSQIHNQQLRTFCGGFSLKTHFEGGYDGARRISRRESVWAGVSALTVASGLNLVFASTIEATESKKESGSLDQTPDLPLTLYSYPLAFNPAKAKLALEEHGIKYTEKTIDLFSGQSLEPWYLKINPNASAPSLVTGKTVILESADIVTWSDEQAGGPLGGDKVDRAFIGKWIPKVDAWDGNLFVGVFGSIGGLLNLTMEHKIKIAEANAKKYPDLAELYANKVRSMKSSVEELSKKGVGQANKAELVNLLDEAEERLGKSKYLAGDEYSIADVIFTPVVYRIFTVSLEQELVEPRPNLKKYWQVLKKRPSYKATFGVADSGLATATTVLPALGKILFSKVTGQY